MRVFARRERPHPGAQLTLFEADDGWRYRLLVPNLPERTTGYARASTSDKNPAAPLRSSSHTHRH
jgi:hypothetical protein